MRVPLFYCAELSLQKTELVLPHSLYRHAIQVLKMKQGQVMRLFDGKGMVREATLITIQKRQASVSLSAAQDYSIEERLEIVLLQGISKGDRMDFAIQKAVELGVTRIVPIVTARCNVALPANRREKRWQHWQQILIHACEQSGQYFLPILEEVMPFEQAIAQYAAGIILSPTATTAFSQLERPEKMAIAIGPEGGFTNEEVTFSQQHHYQLAHLGARILRTETAAIASLAVIQTRWGDS